MTNPNLRLNSDIPVFGKYPEGQVYKTRPGSYAVIFNPERGIAVLKVDKGWFLPGGGMESHETPEECLQREVYEECGFEISHITKIGEAVEYLYAHSEKIYYQIHGLFYSAGLDKTKWNKKAEKDHILYWLTLEAAIQKLTRYGQVWAVKQFLANMR